MKIAWFKINHPINNLLLGKNTRMTTRWSNFDCKVQLPCGWQGSKYVCRSKQFVKQEEDKKERAYMHGSILIDSALKTTLPKWRVETTDIMRIGPNILTTCVHDTSSGSPTSKILHKLIIHSSQSLLSFAHQ